jgi:antitoxin (DNA-binding transcriptional repressor) of toxin-antitoxin stability system
MDDVVPIHAAKTQLSRLIARDKTPVARLVPVTPKGKREFGSMRGKIRIGPEFFEPLTENELEHWGE